MNFKKKQTKLETNEAHTWLNPTANLCGSGLWLHCFLCLRHAQYFTPLGNFNSLISFGLLVRWKTFVFTELTPWPPPVAHPSLICPAGLFLLCMIIEASKYSTEPPGSFQGWDGHLSNSNNASFLFTCVFSVRVTGMGFRAPCMNSTMEPYPQLLMPLWVWKPLWKQTSLKSEAEDLSP